MMIVMQTNGCRVCIEIGHSKPGCKVLDLYNIDDPTKIQQIMSSVGGSSGNNGHMGNIMGNIDQIDHIGNYGKKGNKPVILGVQEGDKLLDDEDDEFYFQDDERKSF